MTYIKLDIGRSRSDLLPPAMLHRTLAHWNAERLSPALPDEGWKQRIARDAAMLELEGDWIEGFRAEFASHDVPTDPDGFITWFEGLMQTGPGQNDPLFDWLANEATHEEMCWFLTQESAGEAGFDDLVALTQVKLSDSAKLELARNYWDEMGRGSLAGMHGPMLGKTITGLGLTPTIDGTVWESLALANTMTAFAATRRYAYHSVGALGVVELTAPGRVAKVAEGMKRLGFEPRLRKYFHLHAVLDVQHSADWNREALRPLVSENPDLARAIAEGALMRLECGRRCFDAYRAQLWGQDQTTASKRS